MLGHWGIAKPPSGTLLDRSHQLAQGLVACWPLYSGNGNRVNSIAGANTVFPATGPFTITGTPAWVIGPRGVCLSFDGSTNYVDTGAKAIMPSGSSFTVACWFRWTQAVGSIANYMLIDANNQQAANGYTLYLQTTASTYTLAGGVRDSSAHIVNCNQAVTGIADNKWHLAVLVRDQQTVTVRSYLDGTLLKTSGADSTTGALGGTDNVVLGAQSPGHTSKFPGQLDMPAIWGRALSAGEILQLYSAPYALFAPYGFLTSFPQPARPVAAPLLVLGL